MAVYQGNKIGVSKVQGLLDQYASKNKSQDAGTIYSIQHGNAAIGGYVQASQKSFQSVRITTDSNSFIVSQSSRAAGFEVDPKDGFSGKYALEYAGEGKFGHSNFEVFDRIREKPGRSAESNPKPGPVYFG